MKHLFFAFLLLATALGCRNKPADGGNDGQTAETNAPRSEILDGLTFTGRTDGPDGIMHLQSNLEDFLGPIDLKGRPVVVLFEDSLYGERTDARVQLYDAVSAIMRRDFGTWPVPVISFLDRNPMPATFTMQEWAAGDLEPRALSDQMVAERAGWSGATHVLRYTMLITEGQDRIVLKMLEAPSGDVLQEEILPASAEIAAAYPAAQRRLLKAAGAKLPPELADTYSDGILGSVESFRELLAAVGKDRSDEEILIARKRAFEASPESPYHFVQLMRMTMKPEAVTAEAVTAQLQDKARPQSAGGALRIAEQIEGFNQSGKAEAAYRVAYEKRDGVIRAGYGLPFYLLELKRVREAIPLMEQAVKDTPSRRYRARVLGEFYVSATIALQAGRFPADMSPADQELLGKLSAAAIAAQSLSHELSPLDAAANREYFEALMRGGGIPLKSALPLAERALERAFTAQFRTEVLAEVCNYSLPQWNNDASAVTPLLWKYRTGMTDEQAEWFFDTYMNYQVLPVMVGSFTPVQYLAAQHASPDSAGLVLLYGDAAIRHRPLKLDHRLMVYAAMDAAAARASEVDEPVALPSGSFSVIGTKPGIVRFLIAEILDRSGDAEGAARELELAQKDGLEPALKWRLDLALAMQKARAGDLSEMLRLVPDPAAANPVALNRRVSALLLGSEAQRIQALEEARGAVSRGRPPLVEDAYYSALLANGQAQAVTDDITDFYNGMESLPPHARHAWREASKATGGGAWPPSK